MQSMTGYGRGLVCEDGREMTVEVKSVNHRFLDVSFRLARHRKMPSLICWKKRSASLQEDML